MKKILTKIILSCVFILSSVGISFSADEIILFWGTTCPHCHTLRDTLEEEGLYDKVNITELEVYENEENAAILTEKAGECGLTKFGIPLLYVDGQCFEGSDNALNAIYDLINENDVKKVDSVGKRNTEKMMLIVLVFIIVLPFIGMFIEKLGGKSNVKKKNKNKNKTMALVASSIVLLPMLFVQKVYAFCPVCTIAIGAGVGFSRYFNIDDTIPGVWIGGLSLSMAYWVISFIEKKRKKLRQRYRKVPMWIKLLTILLTYVLVFVSLYFMGMIGDNAKLFGVDKVLLGIIVGSVFLYFGGRVNLAIKRRNHNRGVFPFQKVVVPIAFLLLATFIFYIIVYC